MLGRRHAHHHGEVVLVVHGRRLRAGAGPRGFTLIELMVVVALVAILLALAAPSLRDFAANQALAGATSDLMGASMTARAAAIGRNAETVIEPEDGVDWLSGWRVYVDKNGNSTFEATTDELIAFSPPLPETIAMNSGVANCTRQGRFVYRTAGFLKTGGGLIEGGIPLKSTVTGRDRCVVFNRIGRTRICGAGIDAC